MSRRDLLKAALLVSGGSAAVLAQRLIGDAGSTESVLGQSNNTNYLPMVRNVPPTPTRTATPTNTVSVPTVGPTKTTPAPGYRPRVV
jgi:hypothetical protein